MTIEDLNAKIESNQTLIHTLTSENIMRLGDDIIGGGWRASLVPVIRYTTQAPEELVVKWINAHPTLDHMLDQLTAVKEEEPIRNSDIINLRKWRINKEN